MKAGVLMPVAEQRGGAEWMLLHLLGSGRLDAHVIFLQDGPMVDQVRRMGIPARVLRAGRLREAPRFLTTILRVAQTVRAEKLDVLISWMATAHLYGGPASLMARVPAFWYQLGMPDPRCAIDRLATLLPARAVFTCSQAAARAQAHLRPCRPTRVVYPGVALERFAPDRLPGPTEARRRLNLPPEGPLIGIVGRLQHWKGMHVLVEAMPQVLARHPRAHCVVVGGEHPGEPEYPATLRQRVAALGLHDRVSLVGLQQDVPLWMQTMDIVVHASRQEPFGIVVIEAMALGKAVVAGMDGGPAEIIRDGVNGLLAPYGDGAALAKALLRYLDDPNWAAQVGASARERAMAFSTDHYARELATGVSALTTG